MTSKFAKITLFALLGVLSFHYFIFIAMFFAVIYFLSKTKKEFLLYVIVFVVFFSKSFLDEFSYITKYSRSYIVEGVPNILVGYVRSDPMQSNYKTDFILQNIDNIKIKLYIKQKTSNLQYGSFVILKCIPHKPENFKTEFGRIFNYKHYLKTRNIHYICKNARIIFLTDSKNTFKLRTFLFSLKHKAIQRLKESLNNDNYKLAAGMIFGIKEGLDSFTRYTFQISGLIHIVVLSGYNIMLVGMFVFRMLRFFIPFYAHILAVIFMVLFGVMVSFDPPTLRATVMGSLAFMSVVLGLNNISRVIFFVVLVLLVFWNTFYLFDMSFLFSFIATFGLLFSYNYFAQHIKLPKIMQEVIIPPLIVFIYLGPFLAYQVGYLSWCSLPSNVFAAGFIFFAMFLGIFSIFVDLFAVPLSFMLDNIYKIAYVFSNKWCAVPIPDNIAIFIFVTIYYLSLVYFTIIIQYISNEE